MGKSIKNLKIVGVVGEIRNTSKNRYCSS